MKKLQIDTIISIYMKWFLKYGMNEYDIRKCYEKYKNKQPQSSANDFIWEIFNTLLSKNSKQSNTTEQFYHNQIDILIHMWEFVKHYEGRTGNDILKDIERQRMALYELLPYKVMVKISSGHCCPYCNALNEKEFTIEGYLQQQPLGSESCTRESGCNCRTISIPQRDNTGRLIR
ncbi:MAG: hypothetical protein ACTHMD_14610 [Flavisolibacter sp.]